MSLWGTSNTDRSKPKFLKAGRNYSPDNCFAGPRGWMYKHIDGSEELLVCIRGLSTALGGAQITEVYFDKSSYSATDVAAITVVFTEKVTKVSGTPTLEVTTVSGRAGSPLTFTYASGSGTNEFIFTLDLATVTSAAGEVLALAAQTIGVATFSDTAGGADIVDIAFASGDRKAAGGLGETYANPTIDGGSIIAVAFGAGAYAATATATVKVKYNQSVTVAATAKTITGFTAGGGDVVFDSVAHGFQVGEIVTVAGVDPVAANGTFTITAKANDTFTVTLADPTAYVSGGTAIGLSTVTLTQTTVGTKKAPYVSGSGTTILTFSLDLTGWGVTSKDLQILAQTLALPSGVTIKAGIVNADLIFASGDRTDSAFTGAYADITLS